MPKFVYRVLLVIQVQSCTLRPKAYANKWNITRGKSSYTLDCTWIASIKHCYIVRFERIEDVILVVVELKFHL